VGPAPSAAGLRLSAAAAGCLGSAATTALRLAPAAATARRVRLPAPAGPASAARDPHASRAAGGIASGARNADAAHPMKNE